MSGVTFCGQGRCKGFRRIAAAQTVPTSSTLGSCQSTGSVPLNSLSCAHSSKTLGGRGPKGPESSFVSRSRLVRALSLASSSQATGPLRPLIPTFLHLRVGVESEGGGVMDTMAQNLRQGGQAERETQSSKICNKLPPIFPR